MATQNKTAAAPPAKSGTAPAEQAPTRTRASLSMEKRLAIELASFANGVAKGEINTGSKDRIAQALKLAKEVNDKVFKKIDDRLAVLQKELAEAATPAALAKPDAASTLKGLAQEMARLQNRRKAITEQAKA